MRQKRVWQDLTAIGVLLLATLGYFWLILLTPEAWKPAGGGDLASFLFPTYRFAAERLWHGDLPLWNPHLYGGVPFLADMQSGLFYPPYLLLYALAPQFRYEALEWMAAGHIFLAGAFTYLCLRYLEPGRPLRPISALAGALAFMFSGIFVVHFGNLNLIAVTAWLPLIFFLFWRALRQRSAPLAASAGLALGVATLAGHLQVTLFIGLALGVAAAVAIWMARRPPQAAARRRFWTGEQSWPLVALALTAGIAVGIAALVLLPALEYARLSPRAALTYREAARYSLAPALLGEMLVPGLFSTHEPALYWGVWDRVAAGYLGVLPLMLAGLALLLHRGRRVVLFGALATVALLLALGGESVVHGWAYLLLPGFGQIRAPARLVLLMDFSLAALAALALECLLRPLPPRARAAWRRLWRYLPWLAGLVAVVAGAWAYLVVYQAQDRDPVLFWRVSAAANSVLFFVFMLGASLAWLGARRTGRLRHGTLGWLAAALIFVDLASVGAYADLGHERPTAGYDHPQVISFLQAQPGLFRIDSRTDVADVWQPDLALMAGLYDVGGVDNPLVVADVARYWEGTGGRSTALYDFLGVRYLVASKDVVLDWDKFSPAYEVDPAVSVYRNETALPRAFLVYQAAVAPDQEAAWDLIHEPGFDPAERVVIEGGAPLNLPASTGSEVQITRYEPDRVEIRVEGPSDGYLVLSDPYYPGWQVMVDGQPASLLRANYAFRAVRVPPGDHQVTMVFRPTLWLAGRAISVATLFCLLLVFGIALIARRR